MVDELLDVDELVEEEPDEEVEVEDDEDPVLEELEESLAPAGVEELSLVEELSAARESLR